MLRPMDGGGVGQISVVIVDDDQLVRRALVEYLQIAPDIKVMATFAKPEAAIEFIRRNAVQVALVDVNMPGMNGVQATREIRASRPGTRVLILTSLDEDAVVHDALDVGASGILLKNTSPEALADAIRAVNRGIAVVSPGPMARIRRPVPRTKGPVPSLSGRERAVLEQLCRGFSNSEIADVLHISESAVKSHITTLMTKLEVTSRLRAVVRAHELGLDS